MTFRELAIQIRSDPDARDPDIAAGRIERLCDDIERWIASNSCALDDTDYSNAEYVDADDLRTYVIGRRES